MDTAPRAPRRTLLLVLGALAAAGLGSCGGRTGLDSSIYADASLVDAGLDQGRVLDAPGPRDAGPSDAPGVQDVTHADASACPPGTLDAYLLSQDQQLYTFDPSTLGTTLLGNVDCGTTESPWTLTVSTTGVAYILYEDWNLYAVDLSTLACGPTAYAPFQLGLTGDEGITLLQQGGAERVFVFGSTNGTRLLGVSDLKSFVLSEVGPVLPAPGSFPLDIRADPAGHIFGLGVTGEFVQIDPASAAVLHDVQTPFQSSGDWALLTYNDEILFFGSGDVYRYDQATNTVTALGSTGIEVVGASAAPCLH